GPCARRRLRQWDRRRPTLGDTTRPELQIGECYGPAVNAAGNGNPFAPERENPGATTASGWWSSIPFESPKLIATAIVNEGSFAELLDQRLKRIEQMKLIEAKPTNENEGSVDARLPPSIPDRRFRRI